MAFQTIKRNGILYGVVVRKSELRKKRNEEKLAQFYTDENALLQTGVITHRSGYDERPHYHKGVRRVTKGTHQMVYMLKGKLEVDFLDKGKIFKKVNVGEGDLVVLMDGAHKIKVLKDYIGLTVKSGPFIKNEQVFVDGK